MEGVQALFDIDIGTSWEAMGESDRKTALEMEVYREGEEDPRQDKKIVRQLGSYRERGQGLDGTRTEKGLNTNMAGDGGREVKAAHEEQQPRIEKEEKK